MMKRPHARGVLLASFLGLAFVVSASGPAPSPARAEEGEGRWISLFNGKDLDGWTPKITGYAAGENFGDTFRVEDGVLKVKYDKYKSFDGKFGHLFWKQKYS